MGCFFPFFRARTRELPPVELLPFFEPWKSWFDEHVEELICLERRIVKNYDPRFAHGEAMRIEKKG